MSALFLLLNLLFGILPSFAFFAWVERSASLPWLSLELGWPWISFLDQPLPILILWNFSLFLLFGATHSLTAQPAFHRAVQKLIPPQALRSIYMMITGLALTLVMSLWQNTGIVIWYLPLPARANYAISILIFWSFMLASGWVVSRFDLLEFVGIRQLYTRTTELKRTSGMPQLETTGIYGRVRHPIYTFTLLAFIITPVMTLDRMIVISAMALYLAFAIPLEERKLIGIFGSAYENYRLRVPAVIPTILKF